MAPSGLIQSQKIIDSAEELSSAGDRKTRSPESVGNHADLVYGCEWTTSRDSCQDSGCMSDLSSGGGSSPPTTISPHQSLSNDCTLNNQVSYEDFALTKHLNEMELDHNHDDKHQEPAGGTVQLDVLAPVAAAVPVQTRAWAPSVPRYVRPMREIPPRFQRLLAAEVDRVVRLCQRLNGSPLYSAATPSNGARQPTNDSRATSSDANRDNQEACVDKALADHSAFSPQSSLIYVTAQSSGLPVYPPASGISVPLDGCSSASAGGLEPVSLVVPIGVAEHGLPTAPEDSPLSMYMANPVFYYPSATLPPPDVASAFSYVMPTPVVGGCAQPVTMETGSQSCPGYVKNAQSDAAAPNDGCSGHNSYYYNSPCPELLPYCSLQMMQA